jgi:hypothetical protein
MLVALIVIVVLVLLVGFGVVGFNKLRKTDIGAQEALGGIDVQLTRRADLIPNLVETVKGYAAHEAGRCCQERRRRCQGRCRPGAEPGAGSGQRGRRGVPGPEGKRPVPGPAGPAEGHRGQDLLRPDLLQRRGRDAEQDRRHDPVDVLCRDGRREDPDVLRGTGQRGYRAFGQLRHSDVAGSSSYRLTHLRAALTLAKPVGAAT